MVKKILLALIIVLVIAQFFPIDKSTPEINPASDLIAMETPPENIQIILEKACYDCHSYKTEYPWYAEVAPVSWWLNDHIKEGRRHLNFSVWSEYDAKRKDHKLGDFAEEVDEKEMPIKPYTWIHDASRLNDEQREELVTWSKTIRQKYKR